MKKLFLVTALAVRGVVIELQAQTDVTTPGDPIIGGQIIGGVFTPATLGTPVGNANMYPLDDPPFQAIDNEFNSTMYRNYGELNTGFVVTPSFNRTSGFTAVTALRIWTGSNPPARDPTTFTLEGTTGDPLTGSYTLIASGSTGLDVDPGRREGGVIQTFSAVGVFSSYRLIFPTVRDSALADSMQVTEVQIRGVAAPEPSILCLLGISAIGLMGARRKRAETV